MTLRRIVLVLLLLNLAAAGWWLRAARIPPPHVAQAHGVPQLQLLDEALPQKPAASPIAALAPTAVSNPAQCVDLGPFTTQAEMREAFTSLQALVPSIQYRVAEAAVSRGWWVYLTAPGREQALALARQLETHGVRDYYVITAGDQQNSISLGLFQEPANAQRRLAQLRALGFPARLRQRVEQVPQYYIEFQLPQTPGFDWRAHVAHPDILTATAHVCG